MCRVCYSERVQVTVGVRSGAACLGQNALDDAATNKVGDGYETYVADCGVHRA